MFDQFKGMVAAAVTQDPIHQYRVDPRSEVYWGRAKIFRVRSAVEISSGKAVSIFQIRMADLDARQDPVADREVLLHHLRRSVALLSQLRHPGILRVERGLIEVAGKKAWFVTERVRAWVPALTLDGIPLQVRALGLRRCGEALRFVQETADVLMVDFSPDSLFEAADGRWKVGDFFHALRRSELASLGAGVVDIICPPSGSLARSVAAPSLDYCAAELVDAIGLQGGKCNHSGGVAAVNNQGSGGGASLNALLGSDPFSQQPQQHQQQAITGPLSFPDSDTYSFLLTTVAILGGSGVRLFRCAGSTDTHRQQRASVEAEVEFFFPSGALGRRPRPPIRTVLSAGPFATDDMQILDRVECYDTMDSNEKFILLKSLYTALAPTSSSSSSSGGSGDGGGMFCEQVIVEYILPLMKRESAQPPMLRFIVPIMLQCCQVLSAPAFEAHLREYFMNLFNAMNRAKAPWYPKVGLLAQLTLERFDILLNKFSTGEDRARVLMPLLLKCLYCDEEATLLACTLAAMRSLFQSYDDGGGGGVSVLFSSPSTAANLAGRLIDLGSGNPVLFSPAFQCLETVLAEASIATKEVAETKLLTALRNTSGGGNSDNSTNNCTTVIGGGGEPRELQITYMISTLQKLQGGFSREHLAAKSIPQLAPLLLSQSVIVRGFAVTSIDKHLGPFRSAVATATTTTSTSMNGGGSNAATATTAPAAGSGGGRGSVGSFFTASQPPASAWASAAALQQQQQSLRQTPTATATAVAPPSRASTYSDPSFTTAANNATTRYTTGNTQQQQPHATAAAVAGVNSNWGYTAPSSQTQHHHHQQQPYTTAHNTNANSNDLFEAFGFS